MRIQGFFWKPERKTLDLKDTLELDAFKAPSLPGLLSAAFTLTSPGTPMCLLLA